MAIKVKKPVASTSRNTGSGGLGGVIFALIIGFAILAGIIETTIEYFSWGEGAILLEKIIGFFIVLFKIIFSLTLGIVYFKLVKKNHFRFNRIIESKLKEGHKRIGYFVKWIPITVLPLLLFLFIW